MAKDDVLLVAYSVLRFTLRCSNGEMLANRLMKVLNATLLSPSHVVEPLSVWMRRKKAFARVTTSRRSSSARLTSETLRVSGSGESGMGAASGEEKSKRGRLPAREILVRDWLVRNRDAGTPWSLLRFSVSRVGSRRSRPMDFLNDGVNQSQGAWPLKLIEASDRDLSSVK